MKNQKRLRFTKIYFRFMMPKNIPLEYYSEVIFWLNNKDFIQVSGTRYTESEKLLSGNHSKELDKILNMFSPK